MRIQTIAIITTCILFAGCNSRNKTTVIDPRTGTEAEAVTIIVDQPFPGQGPIGESIGTTLAQGNIASITTGVAVYTLEGTVSHPVTSAELHVWDSNGQITRVTSQILVPTTELVFQASNSGFMFEIMENKSVVQYSITANTIGLAGETLLTNLNMIELTTDDNPARRELQIIDATRITEIAENPTAEGRALTQNYSYTGSGTSDEVAFFEVTNTSNGPISLRELNVSLNAYGFDLTLETASGVILGARTVLQYSSNNEAYFFLEDHSGQPFHPELIIPAGGTNRFRLRANTTNVILPNDRLELRVGHGFVKSDQGVVNFFPGVRDQNGLNVVFITQF